MTGRNQGSTFAVRDRCLIGRTVQCDIILDEPSVSRRHALVWPRDGGILVEDLQSLNGVYLNNRRIESSELSRDGDFLLVGRFRLLVIGAVGRSEGSAGAEDSARRP